MSNDVYENRLRRMAKRQGLRLEKSRQRDPHSIDYGTYRLVDMSTSLVAHKGTKALDQFGLSIEEVERILTGDGVEEAS